MICGPSSEDVPDTLLEDACADGGPDVGEAGLEACVDGNRTIATGSEATVRSLLLAVDESADVGNSMGPSETGLVGGPLDEEASEIDLGGETIASGSRGGR